MLSFRQLTEDPIEQQQSSVQAEPVTPLADRDCSSSSPAHYATLAPTRSTDPGHVTNTCTTFEATPTVVSSVLTADTSGTISCSRASLSRAHSETPLPLPERVCTVSIEAPLSTELGDRQLRSRVVRQTGSGPSRPAAGSSRRSTPSRSLPNVQPRQKRIRSDSSATSPTCGSIFVSGHHRTESRPAQDLPSKKRRVSEGSVCSNASATSRKHASSPTPRTVIKKPTKSQPLVPKEKELLEGASKWRIPLSSA